MSVRGQAEAFESEQAEFSTEEMSAEFAIVVVALPFELHTPESHTDPGVELLEEPTMGSKLGGEISRGTPDDSVQFQDSLRLEIMAADG